MGKAKKRAAPEKASKTPSPKKIKRSPGTEKASANKTNKLIPATEADIKAIDEILGYSVYYNQPTKMMIGHSAYDCRSNPWFFFPVLLKKPPQKGILPVKDGDQRPYMPGALQIGHIRLALIKAYIDNHPGCDPTSSPWEKWTLWRWNSAYYGSEWSKGPESTQDHAMSIMSGREFGGATANGRLQEKLVTTVNHKRHQLAVWLYDHFVTRYPLQQMPEGARFATRQELQKMHEDYVSKNEKAKVDTKTTKKAVADASEEEDSDDGAESSSAEADEEATGENF